MKELALRIAGSIFLLVGILHLARLILKAKVTIGKFVVPLGLSFLGGIVALSLAIWMLFIAK